MSLENYLFTSFVRRSHNNNPSKFRLVLKSKSGVPKGFLAHLNNPVLDDLFFFSTSNPMSHKESSEEYSQTFCNSLMSSYPKSTSTIIRLKG